MSTTRRSLLAILAAGFAAALTPRVKAAPIAPLSTVVDPDVVRVMGFEPVAKPAFGIPRGVVVEAYECSPAAHSQATINRCLGEPIGMVFPRQSLMLLSTGREPVPLDSPEGTTVQLFGRWISTGKDVVLINSDEGQAILNERAAVDAGRFRW